MRLKTIATGLAVVSALACAGLGCAAYALAGLATSGARQTLEEALAWQSERYDTSFYT